MDFLCTKQLKGKGLKDSKFDQAGYMYKYDSNYILDICKIESEGLNDNVEDIYEIPVHHNINTCLIQAEEEKLPFTNEKWICFKVVREGDNPNEQSTYYWIYKITHRFKPISVCKSRGQPLAMINSKLIFKFNNALYIETNSDEDMRYSYIDPKSYLDMKLIVNVTPRTKTFIEVFDSLIVFVNQNLNCLMYTKTKELGFELNRDMIEVIAVERKVNNGFLIACNAYRNGNPGVFGALCRRRGGHDSIVKIMNITLRDGYDEVLPKYVNDVLSSKTIDNRDAVTVLHGIRELSCLKFISQEQVYIIADGVRLIQYSIDENKFLLKVKEFNYNFDPDSTIRYLSYFKQTNDNEETKAQNNESEYMICATSIRHKVYGLNLQNAHDNILITDMSNKIALSFEFDGSVILCKLSTDNSCKIYFEKVFIPLDKEKIIHQIAFEGDIAQALDIANKLSDSTIASNVMLRKAWESSNRTLKDIEMSLRKIKDSEYTITQCISNTAPNKNILKLEAMDFVNVQRELIKTGIETLVNLDPTTSNQEIKIGDSGYSPIELIYQLLEKEFKLDQYQIIIDAFQDASSNEIIDWESFASLSFIDIIFYLNSVCIIEETPIEDLLLALKEIDENSYEQHYVDILENVDASLMTDKFLISILPSGNKPDKDNKTTRECSSLNLYDPVPYQIAAKRIFLEQIKPSKAYFLLMTGLKRGIKELDFDTIASFEISKLFSIRRNQNTLTTGYDLKEVMRFDTSYERFRFLMEEDNFIEDYFQCMKEIVSLANSERVYKNHYLTHLSAYLDEYHDLDSLKSIADKMCTSILFINPIDGCDMITNEMFKHSVKHCSKINDISACLDDFININDVKERKDERRKWNKLCEIADVLLLYRVTKTKDYLFRNLDELILLPQCDEKTNKVDEIIQMIISEVTSSITLKIGSIIGNDTLIMSIHDCLRLQNMIEGSERTYDVVKMYANVAIVQKKFDLPKAFKKDPQIYSMLEKVIIQNMSDEFKAAAKQSQSESDDEDIIMLISSHQKLLSNLDSTSDSAKEYALFLNLIDFAIERFDNINCSHSKISLSNLIDLYQRNELVEELFNRTSKVERFEELIYELQNNIFMFSDRSQEYLILKCAIKSLLKRWGKCVIDPVEENNESKKIANMIMGYVENFFSAYPNQTDKIIDIILKVINIDTPDSSILKRKQSLLRTCILNITDYEIIDTVTNIYVDLVCRTGYQNDKETVHLSTMADFKSCIYTFLTDLEANFEKLEEYLICRICNVDAEINSITEGYKIIFQHFARLREDEIADEESELQSYSACSSALNALAKCLFICKDNKEDLDDNKFYKQKNLIFMIKNQNDIDLNDVDEPNIDDPISHLKYKIKLLVNEIETVINSIKIKQKEKKIKGKKRQKKLNQKEQSEFSVLDSLKKAENKDDVDLIINNQIRTYDESMREESK